MPQQARLHSSAARRKLYLGGVGAGKTMCGVHEAVYLMSDNPESDGAIVSPTYQMLRDVILPLWKQWVPEHIYTHKKADQALLWLPTGRQIFLRSADRAERLQGLNLAWAWLDEASQIHTAAVWRTLDERIRDPKSKRKCLYATTTPNGLDWLVKTFRDPSSKGFVVRGKTSDNKHLPVDFADNLRALYGTEYAKQFLDAMVVEMKGNVWPYVPAIHLLDDDSCDLGGCRAFYGGVDWGHTNPAALLVGGVDSDGRWHIVDLWYKRGADRAEIGKRARRMNRTWGVQMWYSDHDPEGISQMQREGSTGTPCRVARAKKSVLDGVHFVRSLFAVRSDGEPRIYIHERCRDLISEIEGYVFQDGKEAPVGLQGDHACDALRYLCYTHSLSAGVSNIMLPDIGQANQWST